MAREDIVEDLVKLIQLETEITYQARSKRGVRPKALLKEKKLLKKIVSIMVHDNAPQVVNATVTAILSRCLVGAEA